MDVREQLLEAAVKVFANAGFRGATTRRIAQEAGVNEVTLFRQFGSKEGLIIEAVLRSVERLQDEAVLPAGAARPGRRTARLDPAPLRVRPAQPPPHQGGDGRRPVASRHGLYRRPDRHVDRTDGSAPTSRACATRNLCAPDVDIAVASNVLTGVVFADAMGRDVHPQCYPYSADEAPQRYVTFFLRAIGVRATGAPAADVRSRGRGPSWISRCFRFTSSRRPSSLGRCWPCPPQVSPRRHRRPPSQPALRRVASPSTRRCSWPRPAARRWRPPKPACAAPMARSRSPAAPCFRS